MSILSSVGNALGAVGDVGVRDVGHGLNAADNLVTKGSLHGGGSGVGNALIADTKSTSYDPGTIVNLSGTSSSSPKNSSPSTSNSGGNSSSASTTESSNSTGGTTSSDSAAEAAELGLANTALGQALAALNNGNLSGQQAYTQAANTLNSQQNQTEATEQADLNNDAQALSAAEQAAREQGYSDQSSLDRALAAIGAGGGSVATLLVPQLVQQQVEKNIQGADQTKASNDQKASDTYNQWMTDTYDPTVQKNQQTLQNTESQNQADYAKEQTELEAAIKALNAGVSPSDEDEDIQDTISSIPATIVPSNAFTGQVATYVAPQLSTYELTPTQIAAAAGTATPASNGTVLPIVAAQQQKQNTGNTPVTAAAS